MAEDFQVHIGGDGTPFLTQRTNVPDYKTSSPFEKLPTPVRKPRVDILDLSVPEDYERYLTIWDAVGYGIATVVEEDKRFIESKENWKVFIRWFLNAKMDPKELRGIQLKSAKGLTRSPESQGPGMFPPLSNQVNRGDDEEWL